MLNPPGLDPKAVRRQFARRVHRLADGNFLLREVERQMLERLDYIRIEPTTVLDIGCGLGDGLLAMRQRFERATVIGVDDVQPMLLAAQHKLRGPAPGFFRRLLPGSGHRSISDAHLIVADQHLLPFAPSSADLIWSNLCLHWSFDPMRVIEQWYRVVAPGGLLMFSAFGVDTLSQLRHAGADLMTFPDLHDIGDALVATGFADPVMDMHLITVNYGDPEKLLAELGALGGNALTGRHGGLFGRRSRQEWIQQLLQMGDSDGQMSLSFEICFGHAWCPPKKRRADGYEPIEIQRRAPT